MLNKGHRTWPLLFPTRIFNSMHTGWLPSVSVAHKEMSPGSEGIYQARSFLDVLPDLTPFTSSRSSQGPHQDDVINGWKSISKIIHYVAGMKYKEPNKWQIPWNICEIRLALLALRCRRQWKSGRMGMQSKKAFCPKWTFPLVLDECRQPQHVRMQPIVI